VKRLRRLRLGLATLLGSRPQGFFIPYRYAADLPAAGTRAPYRPVEDLFRRAEPEFVAWLAAAEGQADALAAIGAAPPPAPRWTQDWFPRLDAAIAYTLVCRRRPARIVEIGSGHSTRFLARAVADAGLDCAITAIDPAPRAAISGLNVTLWPATLHAAGTAPFEGLRAGDILFVDSSHILMPGSDVDEILNRILPALPPGVLVHLHDIFLPDDYPAEWAWRGYNEQLGVAALLAGGGFRPLFASHYVASRLHAHLSAGPLARLPLIAGARESSLWLIKEV
jgi:predicted O-methyltransferase YrrM